jgi:enoyl-CoA hydratase/carnithine racemase
MHKPVPKAMTENYTLLKVSPEPGLLVVEINNPPLNQMNPTMVEELTRLLQEAAESKEVRVIIFKSADPDIFISFYDVSELAKLPDVVPERPRELNDFQQVLMNFQELPIITLAQIEGVIGGGGSEFVQALDMRFGAIGKMTVSQMETLVGIIPGAGGTQRLPRLMGKARALEFMLSFKGFGAELAEKYGFLNRALPADEIGEFVRQLAQYIVGLPAQTLGHLKQAVNLAETLPLEEGMLEEAYRFAQLSASPEAKMRMQIALERGVRTREAILAIASNREG